VSYLRPTIVAHPGQVIFEICNATGTAVTGTRDRLQSWLCDKLTYYL
jgi:hypothetical protein